MKKYKIGNIVKIKNGDKCVIVDIIDDEAMVFNISKLEPDKIKLNSIEKIVGEANCTTMVVDGKNVTVKKGCSEEPEEETEETEETEELEETEESEKDNDPSELFGELIKLFGKAAIEIGNILTEVAEEGKKNG